MVARLLQTWLAREVDEVVDEVVEPWSCGQTVKREKERVDIGDMMIPERIKIVQGLFTTCHYQTYLATLI